MKKDLKKYVLLGVASLIFATSAIPAEAAELNQTQYNNIQNFYNQLANSPLAKYFNVKQPTTTPKPAPAPAPAPTPTPTQTQTPAPTTNTGTASISAQEQQMVNLVNQERAKQGLPALQVDSRLVKVSRMKSQDMISNNYFGHQSPTYGSPFDLLKSQGITYKYAGENLAGAGTVAKAHEILMNSAGHRANILDPRFTKIGIGIISGGPYGLMVTQTFIG
ncbi:CAP domain-containing protein [Dendrosporobacter sp. 1207_IL3150]|uniref:CAP domain-containing protein n=1 Tax=Dendrosporobacter sp. 1207_IL3150 TaxID=3084054 RepID=UPI002FD99042